MLFGGNLVRQPAFVELARQNPLAFRVATDLSGADRIMNDGVFVGVYPGLSEEQREHLAQTVEKACGRS